MAVVAAAVVILQWQVQCLSLFGNFMNISVSLTMT